MAQTEQDCLALDQSDELREVRNKFDMPGDELIYLDGNSLGPLPIGVADRVKQVIEKEWGRDLIRSWNKNGWMEHPFQAGDKIASLIGGGKGNVVCCDSTSVNLFKALGAALALRPKRRIVISESGNFPTDLYMIEGMIKLVGGSGDPLSLETVDTTDNDNALLELMTAKGADVAAVCLTHVNYKSGRMHEMKKITKAVHDIGALMIWDLAHSAGAVEVDLLDSDADMAFGCGYKYLNGGPGAPAFIFVAPRLQADASNPLSGWLGHASPFAFEAAYAAAPGVTRFVCGTPQVLSMAALDTALNVWDGLEFAKVRAKSVALCELFIQLVERRCAQWCNAETGLRLASPRDPQQRGSQVSFRHPHGYAIVQAMIARGVIGDFRAPDVLRFGFTPLYLRHVDVWRAVEVLRSILEADEWDAPRFHKRQKVT